jgi:hypothetical protein
MLKSDAMGLPLAQHPFGGGGKSPLGVKKHSGKPKLEFILVATPFKVLANLKD